MLRRCITSLPRLCSARVGYVASFSSSIPFAHVATPLSRLFDDPVEFLPDSEDPGLCEFLSLLSIPNDFASFHSQAIEDIQRIRDEAVSFTVETVDDALEALTLLDDLSNAVCLFLDPIDFYLNAPLPLSFLRLSPESITSSSIEVLEGLRRVQAAQIDTLSAMHALNADGGLLEIVERVCSFSDSFPEEHQTRLATLFLDDMLSRSGDPVVLAQLDLAMQSFPLAVSVAEQASTTLDVLQLRHELAVKMGKDSYAELVLQGNLLDSPSKVESFLRRLARKADELSASEGSEADLDPAAASALAKLSKVRMPLGDCLGGVEMVFERVFGVRMEPELMGRSEAACWWMEDSPLSADSTEFPLVRKIRLVSVLTDEVIGKLYLDFGDPFGIEEQNNGGCDVTSSFRAVHRPIRVGATRLNQIPLTAIVCWLGKGHIQPPSRFSRSSAGDVTLSFSDFRTLFHEFGHALHFVLGQTHYQAHSGTRTAPDFPEFPSQLLERFAMDHRVVSQFAPDIDCDALEVFNATQAVSNSPSRLRWMIAVSAFDAHCHGDSPPDSVSALMESFSSCWRDFIGEGAPAGAPGLSHLVGMGAQTYSYLSTDVLADEIYETMFAANPFDRGAGATLADVVLKPGGSVHPASIVRELAERGCLCSETPFADA